MSRFARLCRIVPSGAVKSHYASKRMVVAVNSLCRVPGAGPGLQNGGGCWVDNKPFSLTTQCMKKVKRKVSNKRPQSKKGREVDEEEEDSDEDENRVEELVDMELLKQEMEEAIKHMQIELTKNVTLRPSTAVYEDLNIETPDGKFPLNQLSQIAIQGPVVIINMSASPQYIKDVDDAMRKELNLNPQINGTMLTIPIPKITTEYRNEMVERVKKIAENSKEVIRHIRSKYVKVLNSNKDEESEDAIFEYTNKINAKVKIYTDKITDLAMKRSKEIKA